VETGLQANNFGRDTLHKDEKLIIFSLRVKMYEGKVHHIEVWKVTYSRWCITYHVLWLQLFNLF